MDQDARVKNDYELCKLIWRMFRDYGDITNNESDVDRWSALVDEVNSVSESGPESRMMAADVLAIMEYRASGKELPHGFPEMDQKLLYRFHKLDPAKQESAIKMLEVM